VKLLQRARSFRSYLRKEHNFCQNHHISLSIAQTFCIYWVNSQLSWSESFRRHLQWSLYQYNFRSINFSENYPGGKFETFIVLKYRISHKAFDTKLSVFICRHRLSSGNLRSGSYATHGGFWRSFRDEDQILYI
jgi:hypothetical protein